MELKKIKSEFKSHLNMVKKYFSEKWVGYVWFILTLTFALMIPFIMRTITSSYQYTFIDFISDGNIVLFSMVIIASLMIDNESV
jgi:hypothetical protein